MAGVNLTAMWRGR